MWMKTWRLGNELSLGRRTELKRQSIMNRKVTGTDGRNFVCTLVVSLLIRFGLMLYGEWQDRTMAVKYTDVDYYVFTDAARFMTKGQSPYLRPTYRYTPLLAWLLQPNIWVSEMFGKIVFILFDILTGYLIYTILNSNGTNRQMSLISACFWLLNPLTATVSSRGNAESIISFLVLLTLKLLNGNNYKTCAVLYALSIHVKIYPITYALPIYLKLRENMSTQSQKHLIGRIVDLLWPTGKQIQFGFIAGATLLSLTAVYYHWYGWDFLEHTYLYHIGRTDIRHNFSVYFYLLYLTVGSEFSPLLSVLLFIPQSLLLIVFSVYFYKDPPLCWFLNTFVFVTFNKVCTSQYFLWYLCLLPLLVPHLKMSLRRAILTLILFMLGQGCWLLPAYYLEFEGFNTFIFIWAAGCLFFIINVYVVKVILDSYQTSGKKSMLNESVKCSTDDSLFKNIAPSVSYRTRSNLNRK